ncbi:MAG TPA: Rrf2 family transcriptional regulator, partial [Firmicutes bacterium]|nr:Rrf2 family transcriptional regulator [Bacillota bacterium]
IADKENISNRYLENIFIKMRKAEILNSVKGEKGGFSLSRPPGKITIADILSAVEKDTSPSKCALSIDACKNAKNCGIRDIWADLNGHIIDYLEKISLEDARKMHEAKAGKK